MTARPSDSVLAAWVLRAAAALSEEGIADPARRREPNDGDVLDWALAAIPLPNESLVLDHFSEDG